MPSNVKVIRERKNKKYIPPTLIRNTSIFAVKKIKDLCNKQTRQKKRNIYEEDDNMITTSKLQMDGYTP